jgi:hypothetical protein
MSSAAITLIVAYANYVGLENFSGVARLLAIFLSAVAMGVGLGFFVQRSRHKIIAVGAFLGLCILWLPVVVVTYGFVLMGLPLLVAFAVLVLLGAKTGANLANLTRVRKDGK